MRKMIRKIYAITMAVLSLTVFGQVHGACENSPISDTCCEEFRSCIVDYRGRGCISLDLLYWRAYQSGFGGGCNPNEINNYVNPQGNIVSKFIGNSKDPHFRWNPGFRLGVGYEFSGQEWDLTADWTSFHTRDPHQKGPNRFHWKLDYETIDTMLGRNFCMDACAMRPFIGVRVAQINQKIHSNSLIRSRTFFDSRSLSSFSDYSSESLTGSLLSESFFAKENNRERFRGIGPLIGIEANCDFGCGFSLYACLSASSLYGHFNLKFSGMNTFLNGTTVCHKKTRLHSSQISTDLAVGIRWQHCFCNEMRVFFQLALEQHRYFDHNRLGSYGDLCLDGGSFSAGLSF